MIEVKTLEIAGFTAALQALRLPFGKECRSECFCDIIEVASSHQNNEGIITHSECGIDPKDLHLMSTLPRQRDVFRRTRQDEVGTY